MRYIVGVSKKVMNEIFNKQIITISVSKAVALINEYNGKSVDDTFGFVHSDALEYINLLEADLEKLISNPLPYNPYVVNVDVDKKMIHLSYEESKTIYEGLIDSLKTMDISGKIAGVYKFKTNF